MLTVSFFDKPKTIIVLEPINHLSRADFLSARKFINAHLLVKGRLTAILIKAKGFSDWPVFCEYQGELELYRDHHKVIEHIAIVTDSRECESSDLKAHFTSAYIRHFQPDEMNYAYKWILNHYEY